MIRLHKMRTACTLVRPDSGVDKKQRQSNRRTSEREMSNMRSKLLSRVALIFILSCSTVLGAVTHSVSMRHPPSVMGSPLEIK